MKTLLLVLSAAGLTGCAVYPEPAYGPYEYGGYGGYGNVAPAPVVVAPPPVYIYGSGVYRLGGYPHAYPHRYAAPPPPRFYVPQGPRPGFGPGMHGPRPWQGAPRVRDGDGTPSRLDRHRDADGARNRHDRRPGNPNRP